MSHTASTLALLLVSALQVVAESHTISFQNNCGKGTPMLIQGANTLSSGEDFTSDGVLTSAIAYLQTGECGFNGDKCALLEMNMNNPSCPGCGSVADISLIPDHALNVPVSFQFYGGDGNTCDGLGASCADDKCSTAFFVPDDTTVQRACMSNDVNLLITFCGSSTTQFTEAVVGSLLSLDTGNGASNASSSSVSSVASSSTSSSSSTGAVASSSSSSANPSATCNRSRLRSKRSVPLKNHARHQARARSYLGQGSF